MLVLSFVVVVLFFRLCNNRVGQHSFRVVSIWRRAAAFIVDFWVVTFTLGALFAIVPLLLEASRTGAFRWQFQRDYSVPSDGLNAGLVLVALALPFVIFSCR